MKNISKLCLAVGLFSLLACEDYLGEKTDLSFIEVPEQTYREVAYVPVQPILGGFTYPSDIIAGFDELIYVVDRGTSQVIAMDQSGRELSRLSVPGAKAIAQDRSLDLLVIGTIIDNSNNITAERSCIYRIDISQAEGYGLEYANYTDTVIHPYYYKSTALNSDEQVVFNRISVLADNKYYVSRSGPSNLPNQSGGPDDAILLFDENDNFETPIVVQDRSGGNFRDYFKKPFGLSSLVKPPQISVDQRGDFLYTSLDPDGVLKVQYIERQESIDGTAYTPKNDWSNDQTKADYFINDPFKFEEPVGVEFAASGGNFIFVVDRAKDSLFQFTANGLEGVEPPPASGESRFIRASFGGTGNGPTQFNEPMAVAFADDIVYVADAGNGRILRFKLTLDIR
ncbi:MAG: hypothetical protein RIC95_05005 [Vicingaceae bacterium]